MRLPTNIKKIAIFRALQLGDMLCAIPAIRALRYTYLDAEITLLGLPWAKSLTERFSGYFDGFIHFPGYPALPEQVFDAKLFAEFLPLIQAKQFDLVIQMQGNGSVVNPMVELFDASYTAGYSTPGHYAPDNGLFMQYPDYGSEIERHITLMEFLGIPSQGTELEFPLANRDYMELDELALANRLEPRNYVCIHPGSRGAWRQWPVNYFASLADMCTEHGFKAVITGTLDEMDIVSAVAGHMRQQPVIAAGKTSLGAVAALINNAALLISNCTGVSHIAAAFKTPSIVISMDGEPNRWGPIDKQTHRTINWLETPDFDAVYQETGEMIRAMI